MPVTASGTQQEQAKPKKTTPVAADKPTAPKKPPTAAEKAKYTKQREAAEASGDTATQKKIYSKLSDSELAKVARSGGGKGGGNKTAQAEARGRYLPQAADMGLTALSMLPVAGAAGGVARAGLAAAKAGKLGSMIPEAAGMARQGVRAAARKVGGAAKNVAGAAKGAAKKVTGAAKSSTPRKVASPRTLAERSQREGMTFRGASREPGKTGIKTKVQTGTKRPFQKAKMNPPETVGVITRGQGKPIEPRFMRISQKGSDAATRRAARDARPGTVSRTPKKEPQKALPAPKGESPVMQHGKVSGGVKRNANVRKQQDTARNKGTSPRAQGTNKRAQAKAVKEQAAPKEAPAEKSKSTRPFSGNDFGNRAYKISPKGARAGQVRMMSTERGKVLQRVKKRAAEKAT